MNRKNKIVMITSRLIAPDSLHDVLNNGSNAKNCF